MNELSAVLHVDYSEQPQSLEDKLLTEIPTKVSTESTPTSEVKKFGSKPYDGGSMIITV